MTTMTYALIASAVFLMVIIHGGENRVNFIKNFPSAKKVFNNQVQKNSIFMNSPHLTTMPRR